ncbi:signal peptide peptidase SppA [Hydrogenimonas cancrithermarum]|uniref:Endopeptidase IV n=1 Tax=Hydrogenimonas cancrithermarum TaxID=2993563 RepID=A0ABN6WUL4_9BACT|nr:signal peptide peptidase SppA [Hydrogenimonas cancrithermarum]BDY12538.1 endopeptidase IV [Hydrogenimonas cancrithermarum]
MSDFFKKLFAPITATLDFIQKYFKSLLFLLILLLILAPAGTESVKPPNLASVNLFGPILSADKIVKELEELSEEKSIKGVLLLVDSPGGAVAPSVEISLAVKRLKEKKPVVAYAAGTMASGSYYASIWADKIVANPAATIGSIGVIMEGMNIRGLLDKVGVKPQVVKAGRYKEAGTPFRKWTPEERKEIETHVLDIYQMFVDDVAKARRLDPKHPERFADAKIFIARKAKEIGLIDQIGSIKEAKELTKTLSGVEEAHWKEKSKWEQYIENLAEESTKTFVNQLKGWAIN